MPEINPVNYKNMILGLKNFAKGVNDTIENIAGAVGVCESVLGENDTVFNGIRDDMNNLLKTYGNAAQEAIDIAIKMQLEIENV